MSQVLLAFFLDSVLVNKHSLPHLYGHGLLNCCLSDLFGGKNGGMERGKTVLTACEKCDISITCFLNPNLVFNMFQAQTKTYFAHFKSNT